LAHCAALVLFHWAAPNACRGEAWGSQEARDIERQSLAREIIGPDAYAYTAEHAIAAAASAAGDADVRWLEEPVFPEDLAGLRPVHDAVACKMATGEYGYDLPSSTRMAISTPATSSASTTTSASKRCSSTAHSTPATGTYRSQRTPDDPRLDGALLLPAIRGAVGSLPRFAAMPPDKLHFHGPVGPAP
jgi:hypothetical protein